MSGQRALTGEAEARAYTEGWGDGLAKEQLTGFAQLLLEENGRQNLISKASEDQLWLRHFADSAQLLEYVPRETSGDSPRGAWIDLGTGPGLPGLVIAILRPDIRMVLVESRGRRVQFLNHCVDALALKNCTVEGQRLERVTPFDAWVISARAFAPLDKLLRLSAPFSTKDTRFLLPKGRSAAHELGEAKPMIRKMFHVKPSLTDAEAGIIVSR